jgi:hypothetical protein
MEERGDGEVDPDRQPEKGGNDRGANLDGDLTARGDEAVDSARVVASLTSGAWRHGDALQRSG